MFKEDVKVGEFYMSSACQTTFSCVGTEIPRVDKYEVLKLVSVNEAKTLAYLECWNRRINDGPVGYTFYMDQFRLTFEKYDMEGDE